LFGALSLEASRSTLPGIWIRRYRHSPSLRPSRRAFCSRASRAASGWGATPLSASARRSKCGSMAADCTSAGSAASGTANGPSCWRLARRAGGLRRCPMPALPHVPLAGGLVGFTAYDIVRFFERLPRGHATARRTAAALRGAAFAAGVRSSDTRHRAAACRQRQRARQPAARGDRGVARADATRARAARARFATPTASLSRDEYIAACAHAGVHRRRRCLSAGALASRFAGRHRARSVPGLPCVATDQSLALHVFLPLGESPSSAHHPRRWSSSMPARRSCARSPARGRAGDDAALDVAREPSCAPIPRRMPST
jgi:hypothetical protein